MVCQRCVKVVSDEMHKLGHTLHSIELGRLELPYTIDEAQLGNINDMLRNNGFEIIDDKNGQLIDRIKTIIIQLIHHQIEKAEYVNLSDFIAKEIGYDYSYLSKLFSSTEGITIEKYLIRQKIEKVKELLVYEELSLSEISYRLGYSSVQHLSNQFKKTTGLAPTHFMKIKQIKRTPLDKV